MSDQLEMFERFREPVVAPAARASDPPSSKAAAERMRDSGRAKANRERVIDAVFKWPGKTSKELAKLYDDETLDRYEFGRRLPEAEREGAIERRQEGTKECRWFPAGEGPVEWQD